MHPYFPSLSAAMPIERQRRVIYPGLEIYHRLALGQSHQVLERFWLVWLALGHTTRVAYICSRVISTRMMLFAG